MSESGGYSVSNNGPQEDKPYFTHSYIIFATEKYLVVSVFVNAAAIR